MTYRVLPVDIAMEEMLRDEGADKPNRVMEAMLQMGKINVAELEKAYAG